MPTYPEITDPQTTAFRALFDKRSVKSRKTFYANYKVKHLNNALKGSISYFRNDTVFSGLAIEGKIGPAYAAQLSRSCSGKYSVLRQRGDFTKKVQELRLFLSMCNTDYNQELLNHLVESTRGSFAPRTIGYPNCCGAYLYDGLKLPYERINMDAKTLKEWAAGISQVGSGPGRFIVLPEHVADEYGQPFEDIGFVRFLTYDNVVYFFRAKLRDHHAARVKKQKLTFVPKLKKLQEDAREVELNSSAFPKIPSQSIKGCLSIYSGFSSNSKLGPRSFTSSLAPVDMLLLRELNTDKQITKHYRHVEALGFKPLYDGFEPFQNSVHSDSNRWLLPMYRINPFYEEDR